MYTLISGSPKPTNSNSLCFLKNISHKVDDYKLFELKHKKYEDILENIKKSDSIIFAFPLYVDSPTSITLAFLDYIKDKKIKFENKLIYVVINCGFREGEQNITALNIIKIWCEKVNATYSGALLIGAGEIVGKEEYKLISKKALKKLNEFTQKIQAKEKSDDIITTMDYINNNLFCYIANKWWKKKCKNNGLTDKDIRVK